MDNPGEILRLCRLCLVKDQVNIPIFEEQGDIRQIFLKISSCLPVKVSLEDKLPKRICDGCSNKLDLLYEFWNTSANAEKTLLSWLGQAGVKDADETISAVAQQIAKPAETQVKQEALDEGHASNQVHDSFGVQSFDEEAKDESEAPPPKRARRTAAVKAQINLTPESDEDDDMDSAEAMTKVEDESDESDGEDKDPSYGEIPGTSADDQAGPSGVGKDGVEAPFLFKLDPDMSHQQIVNKVDRAKKVTKKKVQELIHVLYLNPANQCLECFKKLTPKLPAKDHSKLHKLEALEPLYFLDSSKKIFSCLQCKEQAGNKEDILEHSKSHVYLCSECGQRFSKALSLGVHLAEHSQDDKYMCPICKNYKTDLYYHLHKHINEVHFKMKAHQCQHCDLTFISDDLLRKHIITIHQNLKLYKCVVCEGEYVTQKNLLIHQKNKHRVVDESEISSNYCYRCRVTFLSVDTFKNHFERGLCRDNSIRDSRKKGTFFCDTCGKQVSSLSALRNHQIRIHENYRPFKCSLCPKTFALKCLRAYHETTHSDDRPFACEVCGQSFKLRKTLSKHLLTHEDTWRFVCEQCGKGFRRKSHLTLHSNSCKGPKLEKT